MRAALFRFGLAIAAAAFAAFGLFQAGRLHERHQHQLAQAKAEATAKVSYGNEAAHGKAAVADAVVALKMLEQGFNEIERKAHELRKRYSLLAAPVAVARRAAPAGSAPAAVPDSAEVEAECIVINLGAESQLSLAAVRLWNAALAGADGPAGACGAAGASEEACAAGAGLTVDDAWDNHAINARQCAEDAARHQRLIDYLNQREQRRKQP